MTRILRKKSIDTSKYVNMETGEKLSDELPKISHVSQNTDTALLNYDRYFTTDKKAMEFLIEVLSPTDIGRVNILTCLISESDNVLCDQVTKKPLNKKELAKKVNLTVNKFRDFTNRMKAASVICQLPERWEWENIEHYNLNPYLSRSTKATDLNILQYFRDLSTDESQLRVKIALKGLK